MSWLQFRFEHWVQMPGAAALGRTLLHSLWEGAAVALALAAVLWVARSSRIRYAAACVAMVVMLGGLVVTFARLMPEEPIHIHFTGTGHVGALPPGFGAWPALPPGDSGPMDKLAWLAPFWFAGVLIFHLRGVTSWLAARRLQRTGVCRAPDLWEERLNRLRERLRVTTPVALLESCLAEVPLVIGYVRPIILMPVGLLAGLPVAQVEAILLHELAHIRRYDYPVNLLQVFVEGLLFYHPAVWWISGVMRAERENCCDDLVVRATGSALEYATALTALEERRENAGLALAATGGSLVNRIQRLLGRKERRYVAAMPVFTAVILTMTVVTAMTALQMGSNSQAPGGMARGVAAGDHAPMAKPLLLAQALPAPGTAPSAGMQTGTPAAGQTPQADKVLFDRAIRNIENRNYAAARLTLNTLLNTYTDSEYQMKAKLAIADSWFREGGTHGLAQAEIEYRDFILFYPNSPEAKKLLAQAEANPKPMTAAQQQAKEAAMKQELLTPYKKWMDEDVAYIISDEERKAFKELDSDEEREKFVEQFWERRNPVPGMTENKFKEEIYRRIAYANEHYTSPGGLAGWRTDRGRIYIQYGPPDEIEAHSSGGMYQRSLSEGGGQTETFPFEQWRYRYIDGVGQNIILEFVDTSMKGEYKMTMDPHEKDALLNQSQQIREKLLNGLGLPARQQ